MLIIFSPFFPIFFLFPQITIHISPTCIHTKANKQKVNNKTNVLFS